jgi:hypothetical protein
MKTGVSVQSVCIVLNHAMDNELKEKCLDFIFRHPQQVIETGGYLHGVTIYITERNKL